MPHAIIDYSRNLEIDLRQRNICDLVHATLAECGLFDPADIKTRAYVADDFRVGTRGEDGSFIHIIIYLLDGRSAAQKQSLSRTLLDKLNTIESAHSITVDIRDMDRAVYGKIKR